MRQDKRRNGACGDENGGWEPAYELIGTDQRLKGSENHRHGEWSFACTSILAPVPLPLSFSGRSGFMIAGSMVALATTRDSKGRIDLASLTHTMDIQPKAKE